METISAPDKLHGKLIAQMSLLKSLVAVLPLEALQALLPELERDTEFAKDFLIAQGLTDAGIAAYEEMADLNLQQLRKILREKEIAQTPGGALQLLKERLRSSDSPD
ncbi:hypothetical protein GCM10007242_41270 [Pigmentiphaga litoralis]|uniref:hypothetical protein n=1 Tax=Pigmentiphaga litoralis TaxID=516702 RepID=UPI001677A89F|nr:hypothetical protein [Pigmentiphaga litoralis]GGX30403.1 hypothetical protein GCM10007242_41270 [Pigmentiphaga litoralis]